MTMIYTNAKVILNGRECSFDACVILMDPELREELHNELAPCTEQGFIDAYIDLHAKKYGEDFDIS